MCSCMHKMHCNLDKKPFKMEIDKYIFGWKTLHSCIKINLGSALIFSNGKVCLVGFHRWRTDEKIDPTIGGPMKKSIPQLGDRWKNPYHNWGTNWKIDPTIGGPMEKSIPQLGDQIPIIIRVFPIINCLWLVIFVHEGSVHSDFPNIGKLCIQFVLPVVVQTQSNMLKNGAKFKCGPVLGVSFVISCSRRFKNILDIDWLSTYEPLSANKISKTIIY